MITLPEYVAAQVDPGHGHLPIGVGAIRDGQLESIIAQVLELAAEIERPQAAVRVLGCARPYLGRETEPFAHKRLLRLFYGHPGSFLV